MTLLESTADALWAPHNQLSALGCGLSPRSALREALEERLPALGALGTDPKVWALQIPRGRFVRVACVTWLPEDDTRKSGRREDTGDRPDRNRDEGADHRHCVRAPRREGRQPKRGARAGTR